MKDKTILKRLLPYVIFALGVIASASVFLPALAYEGETFRGLDIARGKEIANFDFLGLDDIAQARLPLNMYAMVAYIAPVFAGIFTLVFKRGNTFALAMFVLAGALFFMIGDYVEIEVTILGEESMESVEWNIAYGALIAGLTSIMAAIGEMLHISISDQQ